MSKFTQLRAAGLVFIVTGLFSNPGLADILHADDVIINGGVSSLCVGNACVDGEAFGDDTIRLKEGTVRLNFDDTSIAAGFPNNDWRIIINDPNINEANYFAIEDATAATVPFRVDAGAPADSLRVGSGGFVGIGTATPASHLHIQTGDNPTVRFHQDGSAGFPLTAQTWDIFGNNASFAIRDVTGGNKNPFIVRSGAPSASIEIAATGRVGVGVDFPQSAPLEVAASPTTIGTGNAVIKLTNPAGPTAFQLDPNNDGTFWNFAATASNNEFRISRSGTGATEMALTSAGNMTITGTLTTGGVTCGGGCDRVFDDDYDLPSIADHARQMWENGYLPNVGPTVENQPVNLSDKTGRMLNELEKAHIYIAQMHESHKKEMAALRSEVAQLKILEARFARLEGLVNQ